MAKQQSGRRRSGAAKSGTRGPSDGASRRKRSPTDHQEIEWQFDADELEPVEGWLGQHSSGSGLVVAPEHTEKITDTYYDTDDWRFYRAGYALRVRNTDSSGVEATIKSLTPAEGNLRRRREISEPLGDDKTSTLNKASGPVGEISRALLGEHELSPMFRIQTHRQRFALLLPAATGASTSSADGEEDKDEADGRGGVSIGEVSLDVSKIPLGEGEEPTRLRRIEIEAAAGTAPTPDLRGFVDEMQFALGLSPTSISKYEAGLYAAGLSPDGVADIGPTSVDPSMSVGEVAFAVLRRQFAEMRAHEPGTRIGEDPEELHDMRVATRRMRAAMKVFEGALPERAKWLRGELRWLAGALGGVRDLDVQLERLQGLEQEADGEGSKSSLGKIVGVVKKRRAEARKNLLEVLDSGRYERLESSFTQMLRRGPGVERELAQSDSGPDPAQEPITSAAPSLLLRRYRKWRKAARRLDETSAPEAFHDVRKKGKRLRYALEFVSEVYGHPVQGLVKPLKALQDDLGQHQDATVAADFLRELGTTTGGTRISRSAAFAMGVYSERYAHEASTLRSAVLRSEPFRALAGGKEWKGFEKAMKGARKSQSNGSGKTGG